MTPAIDICTLRASASDSAGRRQPGDRTPTIIDYLRLYLPEPEAVYLRSNPELKVTYNPYDWALNDLSAIDE